MERVNVAPEIAGADAPVVTPPTPIVADPPVVVADSPAAPERPEWLPEKFKSPEELSKAYEALEKKLGTPTPPPAKEGETPPPAGVNPVPDALSDAEFTSFQNEFAENQKLSEDTYKKLAAKGINKDIVDNYVEGQKAIATQDMQKVFAAAGGEAEYMGVIEWASTSLDPADIAAYNEAVVSGVPATVLAFKGLKAQYESVVGREPKLLAGRVSHGDTDSYQSRAEIVRDMSDPRYAADSAFRKQVERRLEKSTVL